LRSTTLEREPTCKCGAPTPTGGRSSNIEEVISPTSTTRRSLVLRTERIKKLKLFNHKAEMDMLTKDGELSILIRWVIKLTERRDK
jgi:hypothetical protein